MFLLLHEWVINPTLGRLERVEPVNHGWLLRLWRHNRVARENWRNRARWAKAQSRTDSLNRKGVPRGCLVDVMRVPFGTDGKRVVMKLDRSKGVA